MKKLIIILFLIVCLLSVPVAKTDAMIDGGVMELYVAYSILAHVALGIGLVYAYYHPSLGPADYARVVSVDLTTGLQTSSEVTGTAGTCGGIATQDGTSCVTGGTTGGSYLYQRAGSTDTPWGSVSDIVAAHPSTFAPNGANGTNPAHYLMEYGDWPGDLVANSASSVHDKVVRAMWNSTSTPVGTVSPHADKEFTLDADGKGYHESDLQYDGLTVDLKKSINDIPVNDRPAVAQNNITSSNSAPNSSGGTNNTLIYGPSSGPGANGHMVTQTNGDGSKKSTFFNPDGSVAGSASTGATGTAGTVTGQTGKGAAGTDFGSALRAWSGDGQSTGQAVPSGTTGYDTAIAAPLEKSISDRIGTFMTGAVGTNGFLAGVAGSHITANENIVCSITTSLPIGANNVPWTISFCGEPTDTFFSIFGPLFLTFAYLDALFIVFRG